VSGTGREILGKVGKNRKNLNIGEFRGWLLIAVFEIVLRGEGSKEYW